MEPVGHFLPALLFMPNLRSGKEKTAAGTGTTEVLPMS